MNRAALSILLEVLGMIALVVGAEIVRAGLGLAVAGALALLVAWRLTP